MTLNEKIDILVEQFGLDLLAEQNDIDPARVIRGWFERGWIDLDDYFLDGDLIYADE